MDKIFFLDSNEKCKEFMKNPHLYLNPLENWERPKILTY
jgi:hypothetical protein